MSNDVCMAIKDCKNCAMSNPAVLVYHLQTAIVAELHGDHINAMDYVVLFLHLLMVRK